MFLFLDLCYKKVNLMDRGLAHASKQYAPLPPPHTHTYILHYVSNIN